MKKTWAISGVDLHLDLSGTRVRAGLEAALREAVSTGRLAPGTVLPSSRSLAADLSVARNTVAEVYGQLVAEGWLEGRTGSGTSVADNPGREPSRGKSPPAPAKAARYDLRPGAPDVGLFSRRAWLQALRKVLATAPDEVLGYPDPRGLRELRHALASYLARARGVVASPGQVVVCAGFTHGLSLVCRALRAGGATTLAVEAHGHQVHWAIAESHGLRLAALPVDELGAAVEVCGDADGVLLTPAHQFPSGVALHPKRRREVVEWASSRSTLIVEDDYDGEFRYDRQPVGAMQALAPDHVVYAGTASKSLVPGLRLGWLVVPEGAVDAVVAAKEATGASCSSLEQLALAELITSGQYDRQVRQARLVYRRRRDRLSAALAARGWPVAGVAAGLQALVILRDGRTEDDVVTRALEHGLSLYGLDRFTFPGHAHPPALVVGYARPPEHAFTVALARLAQVLG